MPAVREVELSSDLVRGIFDASDPTRLPTVIEALPEVANREGCSLEEAVGRIRLALASTKLETYNSAVNAIVAWSDLSVETGQPFPSELATEIANCCLSRKPRTLYGAFYAATRLARAKQFSIDDVRKLVASLDLLIVETSYENVPPNDPLAVSLTLLRRECVRLSSILTTSSNAPIVSKWLDLVESDPMPEIRFALSDNSDCED